MAQFFNITQGPVSPIKSIQRGTVGTGASNTGTATITSVTTSKAVVRFLGFNSGYNSTFTGRMFPYLTLDNATTVRATCITGTADGSTISFEVVEYV